MATTNGEGKTPSAYDDVATLKKLCNFLRGGQGPPVREALLMDRRVHYLKGESSCQFLTVEVAFYLLFFRCLTHPGSIHFR